MSNSKRILGSAIVTVLALPLVLAACSREVSSERKQTMNPDGSTKTKEKTITESPSGAITKEESSKTTPPSNR
jgi:hypothetical protein